MTVREMNTVHNQIKTLLLTTEFTEPRHVCPSHDLRMFQTWPQCGDIRVLKRTFEGIQNDTMGSVSNGVDVLQEHCKL